MSKIPPYSTPIQNKILRILFQGSVTYNEMRILLYLIRSSIGYATKNGRQKWTKRLTHARIARDTEMAQSTTSMTIKKMISKKILICEGKRYQLNEKYGEWELRGRPLVKNLDNQESLSKESKISIENIENLDNESTSTPSQASDSETFKETYKETLKETASKCIIRLWNYLANRERKDQIHGLIECRCPDDKQLESIIRQRLKQYKEKEIKAAIYNYHKFLCIPDEQKIWRGYCWSLYQFLNHENDNISRFKDWPRVKHNWLKKISSKDKEGSWWER